MKNRAFQQAVHSVLHPVSIAAIGLLLWNDHWLRVHYPSWLSGKLGDFAWLIFAPFVCAAVLAWLIPQKIKDQPRMVGLASCLIIGAWFTLAKTVPAVHLLTVIAWESVINGPISQRLDPTDLLTLPALWISWQLWQRSKTPSFKRRHLGIVVLALGIVATLASDDATYFYKDGGVNTICSEGSSLVIYIPRGGEYTVDNSSRSGYTLFTSTDIYSSRDGGYTWNLATTVKIKGERKLGSERPNCSQSQNFLATSTIQYRWKPAQTIERSTDGGRHWITDYNLYQLRQDVRAEYKPSGAGWDSTPDTSPGPRSGLIDPESGNAIFAMGWDGVLVRTIAGEWFWTNVGHYHLDDLSDFGKIRSVLFFELWEAGALIILVFTTSAAYIRQGKHTAEWMIVTIGWSGWILIACILLPASRQDSGGLFAIALIALPLLFLAALLVIFTIFDFVRNHRRLLLPVLGTGIATAALYLFPLIFWTQGTIARYVSAMEFSIVLTIAGLWAGFKYLRNLVPKSKKKQMPVAENPTEQSI